MAGMTEYNRECVDIMDAYRRANAEDIPVAEFFRRRLRTEEAYGTWASMRITRPCGRPHRMRVEADGLAAIEVDVSDERHASLTRAERREFAAVELRRRTNGLWATLPGFARLPAAERARLRAEDALAGMVQLLSGSHYFMLAYCVVRVQDRDGGLTPPYFWRKHAQFLNIKDSLRRYRLAAGEVRQGLIVNKPRSCGYTIFNHADAVNQILRREACAIGRILDEGGKIKNDSGKFIEMYRNTPKWCREGIATGQLSPHEQDANYTFRFTADDGLEVCNSLRITLSRPKKFEGTRLTMLDMDEIGLYEDDFNEIYNRNEAALYGERGVRTGLLTLGGVTASTNRNIAKIKSMAKHPALYDLYAFFLGKQHVKYVDNETGWADEERCVREENERRKGLFDAGLHADLKNQIMQNPIRMADCFYTIGHSFLNTQKLYFRAEELSRARACGETVEQRGWFRPNNADFLKPLWIPDPQGGWRVLRHPEGMPGATGRQPRDTFVSGCDNMNVDIVESAADHAVAGAGKHSLMAMSVKNWLTGEYVAYYKYRHPDAERDFEQSLLACLHYDMQMCPEMNKEFQAQYFKTFGVADGAGASYPPGFFLKYLFDTPRDLVGQSARRLRKGITIAGNQKKNFYNLYIVRLANERLHEITFPEMCVMLAEWDIENRKATPDLGMALLYTELMADWKARRPASAAAAEPLLDLDALCVGIRGFRERYYGLTK